MATRNYGGQTLYLRKSPSASAPVVYKFKEEITLRPMEIKGDWVKVQTSDGKFTGWIEEEWLCGNALTNCC
jgi:SH3-like domain-containing protein